MNDTQNVLFRMMKIIHRICVENNIRYYMIGGTMLGAVRHKGFIPWDDDMDIGMPRKDFNKFLSLAAKALPEWMEIEIPGERDGNYNFGFAKIADANTTLVEKYDMMERAWGIFIDIFPLDGLGNNRIASNLCFGIARYKFLLLKLNQNLTHAGKSIADCTLRKILRIYASVLGEKRIYRNLVKYAEKHSFYRSDYVANLVGSASVKEYMKSTYFGIPRRYKFESEEFFGVEDADGYLSSLYGNYKTLPPEDKRVPHHGIMIMTDVPYRDYIKKTCE